MAIWAQTNFQGGALGANVTAATEPIFSSRAGLSLVYGEQIDSTVPGQSMYMQSSSGHLTVELGGRTHVRIGYYIKVVGGTQSGGWAHCLLNDDGVNRGDVLMRGSPNQGQFRVRGNDANATTMVGDFTRVAATDDLYYFELEWQQGVGHTVYSWFPGNDTETPSQTITAPMTLNVDRIRIGNVTGAMGLDVLIAGVKLSDGEPIRGAAAPTAYIHRVASGNQDETSFTVVARIDQPDIETTLEVSDVGTFGPVVSDSRGYAHITATGLSANTLYEWVVTVSGDTSSGRTRTLPPTANFAFIQGGDWDWNGSNIYDRLRTAHTDALFLLHTGDFHGEWITANVNPAPADVDQLVAPFESYFEAAAPQALWRSLPVVHAWSDVDSGGANKDSTEAPALTGGQAGEAWRLVFPHPSMPDLRGIQRSFSVGRVRFVITDERTFMGDKTAVDNASKTKLGVDQKAWFKNELLVANDAGQAVVWVGDGPWHYGTANGTDKWFSFGTERNEIASFITANDIKLVRMHSDDHSLYYDDGTNNPYGGFPVICSSPLSSTAFSTGLSLSHGSWPESGSGSGRQYSYIEVTDDGHELALAMRGIAYDSATTSWVQRLSMTVSWNFNRQPWHAVYVGATPALAVYVGSEKVYPN